MHGWLIEDGPKEIALLDWDGELHKLRKPTPDEKRPTIKEEQDGSFLLSNIREADHTVAWKVGPEDYAARSKKFLADGLPKDKDTKDVFGDVNRRFGLKDHVIEAARFAHYAHQLGDKEQASELYVHACKAQRTYHDRYSWD